MLLNKVEDAPEQLDGAVAADAPDAATSRSAPVLLPSHVPGLAPPANEPASDPEPDGGWWVIRKPDSGSQGTAATDPDDSPLPDVIEIDDCAGLQAITAHLDHDYRLVADIDCTDFDSGDGNGFMPIGDINVGPFTGHFDGQGHVITGLHISRSGWHDVALFGKTQGAVVERVGIVDGHSDGAKTVALLIGAAIGTTVREAFATGTVVGDIDVGGLVGAQLQGGLIADAFAAASVTCNIADSGLLVGWVEGEVQHSYGRGMTEPAQLTTICPYSYCHEPVVADSFFDCEVAGNCTAPGGLATTSMQSAATFTSSGWDFDETWGFFGTNDYPCLRWQSGCGCIAGRDTDGDGNEDCLDRCLGDAGKVVPGTCGCGHPEVDTDHDGLLDCEDGCPQDRAKDEPGACGCDEPEADVDNDQVLDCDDPDFARDIHDCGELQAMRTKLGARYRLVKDIDCTGFDVGDGLGFLPVGTDKAPFTGNFDGNGHVINGLTITRGDFKRPDSKKVGLFGQTVGAFIERVGLIGANVEGDLGVGALVGGTMNTVVRTSYATGSVKGRIDVGGLVGGQYHGGTISDSYTQNITVVATLGNVGLVAGWIEGRVERCYSAGLNPAALGFVCPRADCRTAIEHSFFDCSVAGKCDPNDVHAIPTMAMTDALTYQRVSWDFANTWGQFAGGGYPCLRWQPGCGP